MAEVIQLTRRRPERAATEAPGVGPTTLYFDLASPYTYLVAERIERRLGDVMWRPASLPSAAGLYDEGLTAVAQRRAHDLRMPLVWPERFPARVPSAMRVDVDGALAAAREPRRDHQIGIAGRAVGHGGGTTLPALEHERRLYCGETHISAWLAQASGAAARPSAS